jgi:hypothetical protein
MKDDAIIMTGLRAELDAIDMETVSEGSRPYCNFRIADAHGQWRKGWAIIKAYPKAASYDGKRGQPKKVLAVTANTFSWEGIARETGRRNITLKAWVELAVKIGKGEDQFKAWASDARDRFLGQFERKLLSAHKDTKEIFCKVKPTVWLESYETWLDKQGECDLLISDPPYSTDIDDIDAFAGSWLPMALSKVKKNGRAYIFIGAYPREIAAYLNSSMPNQVLVWEYRNTLGPMPSFDYILNWQAILYYHGPDAPKWNDDILLEHTAVQNIGQERPSEHKWQKPMHLAKMLIEQASKEGDIILDPFAGTGTFLLAAGSLGRKAAGCDISPDMVDIAVKRGCSLGK